MPNPRKRQPKSPWLTSARKLRKQKTNSRRRRPPAAKPEREGMVAIEKAMREHLEGKAAQIKTEIEKN